MTTLLKAAPDTGRPSSIPDADEFVFAAPPAVADLAPRGRQRSARRVLSSVLWGFATVVVIFLAVPSIAVPLGFRTLVVTSGSMEPTAAAGDAVVLERVATSEIGVGDIITFRPLRDGGVTTHRVQGVYDVEGKTHFQTKGDDNPEVDPNLVPASNVMGRVVTTVPRIGRAYMFASTTTGRMIFVGMPALYIIGSELRRIIRPRRSPAPPPSRPAGQRPMSRFGTISTSVAAAVIVVAGPVSAVFSNAQAVGANAVTAGKVNAPNLTGATAQLVPCRVNLTWAAPASGVSPDGYDIYRATTSGGPYTFRKHVGAVTSGSDDTGPLGALTTYHYVIQSSRSSWRSANSNQRSVTTLLCVL